VWIGRLIQRFGRFTPWNDPVSPLLKTGCAPGPVWTGAENLESTGSRSPDYPPRIEPLFRSTLFGSTFVNVMFILRPCAASKCGQNEKLLNAKMGGTHSEHCARTVSGWERDHLFRTSKRRVWWYCPPLGPLKKLWKATVSFVVSVSPYARNSSPPAERIFMKVWYTSIFSKICRENSSFLKVWNESRVF